MYSDDNTLEFEVSDFKDKHYLIRAADKMQEGPNLYLEICPDFEWDEDICSLVKFLKKVRALATGKGGRI